MAQHDYNIANASGATVRADLNNALQATVTLNSGATEPATLFAGMFWHDTATALLKRRNAANTAWITIGPIDSPLLAASESALGIIQMASAAAFRANTADRALVTDRVWSAAAIVALSDGATVTPDMSTFINAQVTFAGNRTLASPTNPKVGQSGFILIIQDATGSRTITWGANWDFAGGTVPALSTAPNSVDVLYYVVRSATSIFASLSKAMS
jgi:hypothetical protein